MGDPKLKTTSPEIILVCILHFWLHLVVSKESDLWRDSIWGGALRREGAKTNLATWHPFMTEILLC